MAAFHGFYEWVLVLAPLQYLIGINMGVIAGMGLQIGYWKRRQAKLARPDAVHRLPQQVGSEMNSKPMVS
jgi:hypothetical protein